MIAFVRGRVAGLTLNSAVLEVGGVGLELNCTPDTLATLRIGQEATLPTSMVVREESLTLFGFLDDDEKSVFEMLQTASGVGPKLAQAMLAVHRPDDLRRAVGTEDVKTLTTVPGIGQKGRSGSSSSSRTASAHLRDPQDSRRWPVPPTRRGVTRCMPGWSDSAGPRRRPTTPSTRWLPRRLVNPAPMSPRCSARPSAR